MTVFWSAVFHLGRVLSVPLPMLVSKVGWWLMRRADRGHEEGIVRLFRIETQR